MFDASPNLSRLQTLALLLAATLLLTAPATLLLHVSTHRRASAAHPASKLAPKVATLLSDDALLQQVTASPSFVYFPSVDILLAYTAKGGSTSLFRWLYRGITGAEEYDKQQCASSCWNSRVVYLANYSRARQRRILTGASTLRFAVQRNPFDRLLSAFNDKFSCVSPEVNSQPPYTYIVPYLRQRAGLPESPLTCMSISEFADAVDRVRKRDHEMPLQTVDFHIRPQRLFFEYIPYHMVLDMTQLSNASLLKPVLDRLPFAQLVRDGVGHYHGVKRKELLIPEKAAKKLFRYAAESEVGELLHMSSATVE